MPAGDVFGLDGIFLNKSNPVTVSVIDINSASSSAGIAITGGSFSSGTVTLNLSNAAGLTTTPFYTGAIIGVSSISQAGVALTGYNGTFVVTGFAGTTTVSYATTGYVGPVAASIGTTTIGYVQLLTDGNVTNTTWSSAQTHGWFGGGSIGLPVVSTVDRIDFSNDSITASVRGSLSSARYAGATGNSNYGWFGGGFPGPVSTVDRIDFSNDSVAASPRGVLSLARSNLAATGNSNYGWFGGGSTLGPVIFSTVNRIDFSNDSSTASVRSPLFTARNRPSATGNSNYGWFGGGVDLSLPTSAVYSTVDRINFSNDSVIALVRGPLNASRYGSAATGNSNYGWIGGGKPGPVSTVERIDFSNDSATASVRGLLSSARYYLSATGNSNYGWFGGGTPGPVSTVDRIDFSNDSSTASVRGSLSGTRYNISATSGQARSSSTRLQKAGSYGWFGGGSIPGPASTATVERIDFSNDLAATSPRGSLSLARYQLAATGNSNYGWFGGGYFATTPSLANRSVSTVDRIDFSNDSVGATIRGPLSLRRHYISATGNSNYGWFGGGYATTAAPGLTGTTRIDRIDFSNDFTTASERTGLSASRYNQGATANFDYGWFGGGGSSSTVAVSTVNRINFSNDSTSLSPRGPLSLERLNLAATGNSNYGWFGGGSLIGASPAYRTVIDRVNFSNDSVTASPRGPLTAGRSYLAATGNSNYGWFGGGTTGVPATAVVDCINFSNDSVTASVRGPLSVGRYLLAATSNRSR